jgi:hypothetical protein
VDAALTNEVLASEGGEDDEDWDPSALDLTIGLLLITGSTFIFSATVCAFFGCVVLLDGVTGSAETKADRLTVDGISVAGTRSAILNAGPP